MNRVFKLGDEKFAIPENRIKEFLRLNPDAVEQNVTPLKVGDKIVDVPDNKVNSFVKQNPNASKDIWGFLDVDQDIVNPKLGYEKTERDKTISRSEIDASEDKKNQERTNAIRSRRIRGLIETGDYTIDQAESKLDQLDEQKKLISDKGYNYAEEQEDKSVLGLNSFTALADGSFDLATGAMGIAEMLGLRPPLEDLSPAEKMQSFSSGIKESLYKPETGFLKSSWRSALNSAPMTAEAFTVGAVTKGLKLGANLARGARVSSMALPSTGNSYLDLKRNYEYSEGQKYATSIINGLIEGGTEEMGTFRNIDEWAKHVKKMVKQIGVEQTKLQLMKNVVKSSAVQLGVGADQEGKEEVLNALLQPIIERAILDKPIDANQLIDACAQGYIQGAISSALVSPVFGAVSKADLIGKRELFKDSGIYVDKSVLTDKDTKEQAELIAKSFLSGNRVTLSDEHQEIMKKMFIDEEAHESRHEAKSRNITLNNGTAEQLAYEVQEQYDNGLFSEDPEYALEKLNSLKNEFDGYIDDSTKEYINEVYTDLSGKVKLDKKTKKVNYKPVEKEYDKFREDLKVFMSEENDNADPIFIQEQGTALLQQADKIRDMLVETEQGLLDRQKNRYINDGLLFNAEFISHVMNMSKTGQEDPSEMFAGENPENDLTEPQEAEFESTEPLSEETQESIADQDEPEEESAFYDEQAELPNELLVKLDNYLSYFEEMEVNSLEDKQALLGALDKIEFRHYLDSGVSEDNIDIIKERVEKLIDKANAYTEEVSQDDIEQEEIDSGDTDTDEYEPYEDWENNLFKARHYANHLKIDYSGKDLEQLVKEINEELRKREEQKNKPKKAEPKQEDSTPEDPEPKKVESNSKKTPHNKPKELTPEQIEKAKEDYLNSKVDEFYTLYTGEKQNEDQIKKIKQNYSEDANIIESSIKKNAFYGLIRFISYLDPASLTLYNELTGENVQSQEELILSFSRRPGWKEHFESQIEGALPSIENDLPDRKMGTVIRKNHTAKSKDDINEAVNIFGDNSTTRFVNYSFLNPADKDKLIVDLNEHFIKLGNAFVNDFKNNRIAYMLPFILKHGIEGYLLYNKLSGLDVSFQNPNVLFYTLSRLPGWEDFINGKPVNPNTPKKKEIKPKEKASGDTSKEEVKNENNQGNPDTKKESKPQAKTSNSSGSAYGSENKVITQSRYDEIKKKLLEKASQMNVGIDPEFMTLTIEACAYHIEAGVRKFAKVAKTLITEFSEISNKLKPYLKGAYKSARDFMPAEIAKDMDSDEYVSNFDLENITLDDTNNSDIIEPESEETNESTDTGRSKHEQPDNRGKNNSTDRGGETSSTDEESSIDGTTGSNFGNDRHDNNPDSSGDELSESVDSVEGSSSDRSSGRSKSGNNDNGLLPGKTDVNDGRINYDLRNKEYLSLSKSQRKKINNEVLELLKKDPNTFTDDDKLILSQYTGKGGIGDETGLGILTQFYTPYDLIKSIYKALDNSGFKFNTALEPAVGSGNFIGLNPGKKWTAIDLDEINTKIASILYPKAEVINSPYEKYLSSKKFDLVISNVPFLEKNLFNNMTLHDYFFVKSLNKVKDDGLIVFITSSGTMDKKSDAYRSKLMESADLVTAYRLPSTAFKSSHTQVITDLIILQKRPKNVKVSEEQTKINKSFKNTDLYQDQVILNQYYIDHPENVLGETKVGTDQFGGARLEVSGEADLSKIKFNYKPYIGLIQNGDDTESNSISAYTDQLDLENIPYRLDKPKSDEIIKINDLYYVLDYTKSGFSDSKKSVYVLREIDPNLSNALYALLLLERMAKDYQATGIKPNDLDLNSLIIMYRSETKDVHPAKYRLLKSELKNNVLLYNYLSKLINEDWSAGTVFTEKVLHSDSGKLEISKDDDPILKALSLQGYEGKINLESEEVKNLLTNDEIQELIEKEIYCIIDDFTIQNSVNYYSGNVLSKYENAKMSLENKRDNPLSNYTKLSETLYFKNDDGEYLKASPKSYTSEKLNELGLFIMPVFSIAVNPKSKATNKIKLDKLCAVSKVSGDIIFKIDIPSSIRYIRNKRYISPEELFYQMIEDREHEYLSEDVLNKNKEILESKNTKTSPSYKRSKSLSKENLARVSKQAEKLLNLKPEDQSLENMLFDGNESWIPITIQHQLGIQSTITPSGTINYLVNAEGFDNDERQTIQNYLKGVALFNDKDSRGNLLPALILKNLEKEAKTTVENWLDYIKTSIMSNTKLYEELTTLYNLNNNFYIAPDYSKMMPLMKIFLNEIPKEKDGKPFALRKNQIDWVMTALYEGRGINAHDVGGGKTYAGILLARVLKKTGMAKKPMFVLPSKVILKWERDIKFMYPDAKVINLGKLSKSVKEQRLVELQQQNADYVLISQEAFTALRIKPENSIRYLDETVQDIFSEKLDALDGREGDKAKKDQAKLQLSIDRFKKALEENDNKSEIAFEDLGIDCIIADEAHAYKNLPVPLTLSGSGLGMALKFNKRPKKENEPDPDTKENDKAEGNNQKEITDEEIDESLQSFRSFDFRFKTRYVLDNNNNSNIFLLTATPTPNKILEVYNMFGHIGKDILSDYKIDNITDFFKNFINLDTIVRPDGTAKVVVRAIRNAYTFKQIMSRFIDHKATEEMEWIKRPSANVVKHPIRKDERDRLIQYHLYDRLKNRDMTGEPFFKIYSAGVNSAVDGILYDKYEVIGEDLQRVNPHPNYSKIHKVCDMVSSVHKSNKNAGQLIFLDLSGESKNLFISKKSKNLHEYMKELLVKEGFKPEEVAIISSKQITDKDGKEKALSGDRAMIRKDEIVQEYNAGKIKVIIGSTKTIGEGMDIQVKTTDLYNINVPFTPAELIQRVGRGVRSGNENNEVNIHYFFKEGSFDEKLYSLVSSKQSFNDALYKTPVINNTIYLEDSDSGTMPTPFEIKMSLAISPEQKATVLIEQERDNIHTRLSDIRSERSLLKSKIQRESALLDDNSRELEELSTFAKNYENTENKYNAIHEENIKEFEKFADSLKNKIKELKGNGDKKELDITESYLKIVQSILKVKYPKKADLDELLLYNKLPLLVSSAIRSEFRRADFYSDNQKRHTETNIQLKKITHILSRLKKNIENNQKMLYNLDSEYEELGIRSHSFMRQFLDIDEIEHLGLKARAKKSPDFSEIAGYTGFVEKESLFADLLNEKDNHEGYYLPENSMFKLSKIAVRSEVLNATKTLLIHDIFNKFDIDANDQAIKEYKFSKADNIARAMGAKGIIVFDGSKYYDLIDGAMYDGYILVPSTSDTPTETVLRHELVHILRSRDLQAFNEISDILNKSETFKKFYEESVKPLLSSGYDESILFEESVANYIEKNITNKYLWNLIASKNKSILVRLYRSAQYYFNLAKIKLKVKAGLISDTEFTDRGKIYAIAYNEVLKLEKEILKYSKGLYLSSLYSNSIKLSKDIIIYSPTNEERNIIKQISDLGIKGYAEKLFKKTFTKKVKAEGISPDDIEMLIEKTPAKIVNDERLKHISSALTVNRVLRGDNYIDLTDYNLGNRPINALADVLGFIRNPHSENFAYVFLKGNTIAGYQVISSGLPAQANILPKNNNYTAYSYKLLNIAKKYGADSIYCVHNHPTGDPYPSNDDLSVNNTLIDYLGSMYKGHLVLNHETFSFIPPTQSNPKLTPEQNKCLVRIPYTRNGKLIKKERLGAGGNAFEDENYKFSFVDKLKNSHDDILNDKSIVLILLNVHLKVNGIYSMDNHELKNKDQFSNRMKNLAKETGSYFILGISNSVNTEAIPLLQELVLEHKLTNAQIYDKDNFILTGALSNDNLDSYLQKNNKHFESKPILEGIKAKTTVFERTPEFNFKINPDLSIEELTEKFLQLQAELIEKKETPDDIFKQKYGRQIRSADRETFDINESINKTIQLWAKTNDVKNWEEFVEKSTPSGDPVTVLSYKDAISLARDEMSIPDVTIEDLGQDGYSFALQSIRIKLKSIAFYKMAIETAKALDKEDSKNKAEDLTKYFEFLMSQGDAYNTQYNLAKSNAGRILVYAKQQKYAGDHEVENLIKERQREKVSRIVDKLKGIESGTEKEGGVLSSSTPTTDYTKIILPKILNNKDITPEDLATRKPNFYDYLLMSLYTGFLSSPATHGRNTISTFLNTNILEPMINTIYDFISKHKTVGLAGFGKGLKEGLIRAGEIISGKESADDKTISKFGTTQDYYTFDNNEKIQKAIYRVLTLIPKFLKAEDAVFYSQGFDNSLSVIALELSFNKEYVFSVFGEQLSQEEAYKRLNENPTDIMIIKAKDYALDRTFNKAIPDGILGHLVMMIEEQRFKYEHGSPLFLPVTYITRIIMPFTRIVANVTNASLDYTPIINIFRSAGRINDLKKLQKARDEQYDRKIEKKIEEGNDDVSDLISNQLAHQILTNREINIQISKAVAGSLLAGLFTILAGSISGGGSPDREKTNQLRKTGWQEYSFNVAGKWISYKNTPGLNLILAIIGNTADWVRYGKYDDKSLLDRLAYAVLGIAKTITDQSFLSGLSEANTMLELRSVNKLQKFLSSAITTPIPASWNGVKYIHDIFDPSIKNPETLALKLKNDLRVFYDDIPNRIDTFGNVAEKRSPKTGLTDFIGNSLGITVGYNSFENAELEKITKSVLSTGYKLPTSNGNIAVKIKGENYDLSPEDKEKFLQYRGEKFSKLLLTNKSIILKLCDKINKGDNHLENKLDKVLDDYHDKANTYGKNKLKMDLLRK